MPSAYLQGCCYNAGVATLILHKNLTSDGFLSVTCPNADDYVIATLNFASATAWVKGYNGEFAGMLFALQPGNVNAFVVPNANAAEVFINHQHYNLNAAGYFVKTNPRQIYHASNSSASPTDYQPGAHLIRIGPTRVGLIQRFLVPHEYGHSFHFEAIDPWVETSYYCGPNGHHLDSAYTSSCAYIEGFADFFAVKMHTLADGHTGNTYGLNRPGFAGDSII